MAGLNEKNQGNPPNHLTVEFNKGHPAFEAKTARKQNSASPLFQIPSTTFFVYCALPLRRPTVLRFGPWTEFDYARPPLIQD